MRSGSSHHSSYAVPAYLTGPRAAMCLALGAVQQERESLNVHAVLNLLNRCVGTDDADFRDELVSRLAQYLAASSRVQGAGGTTLAGLCELARSYAAMRYLMADAIEPRFECHEGDVSLRTEQSAEMVRFVQRAVDSLLEGYTPRVFFALKRLALWKIELTLTVMNQPGQPGTVPQGWTALDKGEGCFCRGRFTAIARPVKSS
ncbi:hypothetical protein GT347_13255 [Xylophilus rhododendri]|uniref:Uncharacterized protein n=1 Tax=Xylophilus rhododendri TaxID=2697032 RepID=A0A857J6K6_9BURK|nr:hypothetical protein [Xylophilus rhododendri]QHI98873.1 hypothetical protein GT347_13255 [Xylophilus rhododendri]